MYVELADECKKMICITETNENQRKHKEGETGHTTRNQGYVSTAKMTMTVTVT